MNGQTSLQQSYTFSQRCLTVHERKRVMSTLQESLHRFLAVEGVQTAALIDIATGMIVRSVGKPDPDLATTAACVADEARAAQGALGGAADSLVEIATIMDSR